MPSPNTNAETTSPTAGTRSPESNLLQRSKANEQHLPNAAASSMAVEPSFQTGSRTSSEYKRSR